MSPVTGGTTKKTTTTGKTSTGKSAAGAPKKGKKKIAAAPLKSKTESKKLVNPLFEKRTKNFGIGQGKTKRFPREDLFHLDPLDQISSPNVIYRVSSNGLTTFAFNVNVRSCWNVWRCHHQSTNSHKRSTNKHRPNCSNCWRNIVPRRVPKRNFVWNNVLTNKRRAANRIEQRNDQIPFAAEWTPSRRWSRRKKLNW